MKRLGKGYGPDSYVSEGKIFEVIPVIVDAAGQPMMLPPALWRVENWVLGYQDTHGFSSPVNFFVPMYTEIPGSRVDGRSHKFYFLVRILEDGETPGGVPLGAIDVDAVRELMQALRGAPGMHNG